MQQNTQPHDIQKNIAHPPLVDILASMHTAEEQPEIDWGEPVGEEVW